MVQVATMSRMGGVGCHRSGEWGNDDGAGVGSWGVYSVDDGAMSRANVNGGEDGDGAETGQVDGDVIHGDRARMQ